ncbi:MAG: type II toxin-antitoxin system VapB family antitoxin [Phycisphaerales bacterium]|nr:type II toxin-antitoxin system VapB family antitoxin [Phycisphaerales bacterium]
MRTTLDLDSNLFAQASRITGLREKTAVIHAGLRLIIERDAARQLIALGGTMPDARAAPRRKSEPSRRTAGRRSGGAARA